MKQLLIIGFFMLFCRVSPGQQVSHDHLVTINRQEGLYLYSYQALASDTSVKHGGYELLYKNRTLERGTYRRNQRVGAWQFFNLNNALEFSYDYTKKKVSQFEHSSDDSYDVPSFYLGSPLIPYFFMVSKLHYPGVEMDNDSEQEVLVSLRISKEGKMTGIRLVKNSRAAFNESVMNAAAQLPDYWEWLPAQKNGVAVESDYIIKIIFEPVKP